MNENAVEELRELAKRFDVHSTGGGEEAIDRVAIAVLKVGAALAERLEALTIAIRGGR